jgi:hypothetical protein
MEIRLKFARQKEQKERNQEKFNYSYHLAIYRSIYLKRNHYYSNIY